MANLEILDEIVDEISKIRGVDLPKICIKMIVLTYLSYACNTFDIVYKNEDGYAQKINVGCIILCQKGTGKSRTLHALKIIFKHIEYVRQHRYDELKEIKIGKLERSMIPLTSEEKKIVENFYKECGFETITIFNDPITSKGLCEIYTQIKRYNVNNLLFTVDEAGDRIFKEALGRDPSISAKEFLQTLNQLFDGYCGMGRSSTSKTEGVTSQTNVGANFIFVSTAEFLKDYHVQQKYESIFEGGLGRRCLYVNCPPIDKLTTDRHRYFPNFERFVPITTGIFNNPHIYGQQIQASQELWEILEQPGAGSQLTIDEEYLLLLFCTSLAVWTGDMIILPEHWFYMVKTYKEMKNLALPVINHNTNNYDRICVFIQEWFKNHSTKTKMPVALVKDYCVRNKMCFDSQFKKWFKNLCDDFKEGTISRFIIEKNQLYVWLSENYAHEGK